MNSVRKAMRKEKDEHDRSSHFIGQHFGAWTLVSWAVSSSPNKKVHCRCSCGTEKDVFWSNLKYGKTKSYSCKSQIFKGKDLRGQRFGALQALQELKERDKEIYDKNIYSRRMYF